MTALQLAYVVPVGRLSLASVLLGVPGRVLADGGGDARYLGIAAIITALLSGAVALVGAVASAVVKLRAATGTPSAADVAAARAVLDRAGVE